MMPGPAVAGACTGGQSWAQLPLQFDLVLVSGTNQYMVKPLALVSTVTPLSVMAVPGWHGPGWPARGKRARVLAGVAAAGLSCRAGLSARGVRRGLVGGPGWGAEECFDEGGQVCSLGDQVKVAAVVDGQLASRDQPVQDPRVELRDDGVVVAGQDQGGRAHPRQQRQAHPAGGGQELVVVAPGREGACGGVQQLAGERGIVAHAAAVKFTGDAGRIPTAAV